MLKQNYKNCPYIEIEKQNTKFATLSIQKKSFKQFQTYEIGLITDILTFDKLNENDNYLVVNDPELLYDYEKYGPDICKVSRKQIVTRVWENKEFVVFGKNRPKFTSEQQKVIDFNFIQNLIVNAVAGSGKTTTLIEMANKLSQNNSKKVLFTSFTREIVSEINRKLMTNNWDNAVAIAKEMIFEQTKYFSSHKGKSEFEEHKSKRASEYMNNQDPETRIITYKQIDIIKQSYADYEYRFINKFLYYYLVDKEFEAIEYDSFMNLFYIGKDFVRDFDNRLAGLEPKDNKNKSVSARGMHSMGLNMWLKHLNRNGKKFVHNSVDTRENNLKKIHTSTNKYSKKVFEDEEYFGEIRRQILKESNLKSDPIYHALEEVLGSNGVENYLLSSKIDTANLMTSLDQKYKYEHRLLDAKLFEYKKHKAWCDCNYQERSSQNYSQKIELLEKQIENENKNSWQPKFEAEKLADFVEKQNKILLVQTETWRNITIELISKLRLCNPNETINYLNIKSCDVENILPFAKGLVSRFQLDANLVDFSENILIDLVLPKIHSSLKFGFEQAEEGELDFEDMLWLPVYFDLKSSYKCDIVLVDEAQDMNELMYIFVTKSIAPNTQIVLVGDDKQAIYGFAGSTSGALKEYKTRLNAVELPMTTCFRCPPNVLTQVNFQFDTKLEPARNKQDGTIGTGFENLKEGQDILILARFNLPLYEIALQMRRYNYHVSIEKNSQVLEIYKKIVENFGENIVKGIRVEKERIKLTVNNKIKKIYTGKTVSDKTKVVHENFLIAKLTDDLQVLELLWDDFERNQTTPNFKYFYTNFVANNKSSSVRLMSIHKSKGLEAENVYILNTELISKKVKFADMEKIEIGDINMPFDPITEENLKYVALTRTKQNLYFVPVGDNNIKPKTIYD